MIISITEVINNGCDKGDSRLREWESDFPWTGFPSAFDWSVYGVKRGQKPMHLRLSGGLGSNHFATALRNVWGERKQRRPNPVVAVHLESEDGNLSNCSTGGNSREGITLPIVSITEIGPLTLTILSSLKSHLQKTTDLMPAVLNTLKSTCRKSTTLHGVSKTMAYSQFFIHYSIPPTTHRIGIELSAQGNAIASLYLRREELTEELGFSVEMGSDGRHHILRVDDNPTALGLFLPADEGPRTHVARFGESPVLYGFRISRRTVLFTMDYCKRWRSPSTFLQGPDVGVGKERENRDLNTEIMLDMIADQDAGYVPLLFSSDALREEGYLEELIRRSCRKGHITFGERLRRSNIRGCSPSSSDWYRRSKVLGRSIIRGSQ